MPDTDAIASVRDNAKGVAGQDRKAVRARADDGSTSPLTAAAPPETAAQASESAALPATAADEAAPRAGAWPHNATTADSEIELKLLVEPDRLADFNSAPVVATHARNKGAHKHLKSVYYDTPARTLRRNGFTLRVRQSGTRFVQTLKAQHATDPLRRGEWEAPVTSLAPALASALPLLPERLRADIEQGPLDPVFVTDIHRHQRMLDLPSGAVEIAFDHGTISAGEAKRAISEIELELKGGSPSAIYEVALQLADHGPLRPSTFPKSARGYDLADGRPPRVEKPRKLRLDPEITLDETFTTILRGCYLHLLQAVPAAEDGRNPEGVHQLRVALRRLRAGLKIVQAIGAWSRLDALSGDARWLAQNLAAARDWDIFQTVTAPAIAAACPAVGGFDTLIGLAEQQRVQGYHKLRTALADQRCARFVLSLGEWIEVRGWRSDLPPETLGRLLEPAVSFAGGILSARHRKVIKRGRHFKSLSTAQRHHLRLALKKLRYSVDFLLPLYGQSKPARRYARKLAGLQEQLGCYNDMAITETLLSSLNVASTDAAIAAAAITGWQAHAMVAVETPLRKAWRDFANTETPWSEDED